MAAIYASVIVPRPLDVAFTYRVPSEMADAITVGQRVIVPFGTKRYVTGIVENIMPIRPAEVADVKDISSVLDRDPIVKHPQLKFWHWLSDYYMCPIGDVFKAAMPAGLKVESESVVELGDDIEGDVIETLTEKELKLVEIVKDKGKVSIKELAKALYVNSAEARVARLVEKGVLVVHESLVNRYRRVKIQMLTLTIARGDSEALKRAFDLVKRSKGQQQALLNLIALSGFNKAAATPKAVARHELLESSSDITWTNVTALQSKGLLSISTREVSRFSAPEECTGEYTAPLPELSADQSTALNEIHKSFFNRDVTLLHGVTASGKTEIYIHLIQYVLEQGRQALFLVPEIALTTQLTRRLQRVFGRKVRIYHSKFSDNERVDIWRDMLADPNPCVVIGARSAVFLPFTNLGLVIVDEEHEPSYKQYDPAPRYNGRDAAIVLASMHGAKTLLGSATPTIETYYKATEGDKYGLVSLAKRYGDVNLPTMEIVDMGRERKKNAVDGVFANITIAEGRHVLTAGRQIICFHNRRGFSPRARCKQCQFTPKCDFCDVSLTYHKRTNTLECHYCGATYSVPKICPACKEPAIEIEGYGTERVEDGIAAIYPDAKILRMDLDTTRNKEAYSNIIDDFSQHKADILVGTQMVTKGLDFGAVGLVAVVNADNVLNYPDFRSSERAFNMFEQVAGRAGRRGDTPGKVMIQTYTPDHPVISFVKSHDYAGFYVHELAERQKYNYPPFVRIVNIYLKHRDRAVVDRVAREYSDSLRSLLGNRVSVPIEPSVERVASLYIRQVMLRVEISASIRRVKEVLRSEYLRMNSAPVKTGVIIYYDVDPV